MTAKLVNTLKTKLVAAELKSLGISDSTTFSPWRLATRVDESTGALIGLDADGSDGIGSGPDYRLSVADVARDLGATDAETAPRSSAASSVQGNPFRPGPQYNLTAQIMLMKSDPILAEDLAAEAGSVCIGITRETLR